MHAQGTENHATHGELPEMSLRFVLLGVGAHYIVPLMASLLYKTIQNKLQDLKFSLNAVASESCHTTTALFVCLNTYQYRSTNQ